MSDTPKLLALMVASWDLPALDYSKQLEVLVRELETENAALRKDKERLDWLIKNQIGVAYGAVSFEAFDKITRAAIDAARKEAQP